MHGDTFALIALSRIKVASQTKVMTDMSKEAFDSAQAQIRDYRKQVDSLKMDVVVQKGMVNARENQLRACVNDREQYMKENKRLTLFSIIAGSIAIVEAIIIILH